MLVLMVSTVGRDYTSFFFVRFFCSCFLQAMVGTGEALLNVRAKGAPPSHGTGARGPATVVPATAVEFDFQSELLKFDKVIDRGLFLCVIFPVSLMFQSHVLLRDRCSAALV